MKRQLLTLLLLFTISFLFAQENVHTVVKNIPYYAEASTKADAYMSERCALDIYYPKSNKDFATVIWFHGGGLTAGSIELQEGLKDK